MMFVHGAGLEDRIEELEMAIEDLDARLSGPDMGDESVADERDDLVEQLNQLKARRDW